MRLLHFIPSLTNGGAERQLGYLVRELRRRGHELLVAYLHDGPAPSLAADLPAQRLRSQWHILPLLRRWRPDVLTTWYVESDIVGGIAAILTRTPWVLREPSTPPLYTGRVKTWLRKAVARIGGAVAVAHTPAGAAYWSGRLLPKGVPVPEIDAAARASLNASPVVVYAGRLEAIKNVDVAIEAAALLDATLIVCGDGPRRPALERMAGPRVRFLGFVCDIWPVIKGADALVSLSDFEGAPNSVLEAFAAGTPVVLSDVPGQRAIAGDDCAFFVPPRDPAATAAAIRRVLDDRTEATLRARNARARVETMTVAAMADAYEEIYGALRR